MTIRATGALLGALGFLCASADLAAAVEKILQTKERPGAAGLQIKNIPTGPGDDLKKTGGDKGKATKRVVIIKHGRDRRY